MLKKITAVFVKMLDRQYIIPKSCVDGFTKSYRGLIMQKIKQGKWLDFLYTVYNLPVCIFILLNQPNILSILMAS